MKLITPTFVVFPSYNEEKRLPATIAKVKTFVPLHHIVVVDDGSKIPIASLLPRGVIVARHKVNLGKGMALRTGCELAIKNGAKSIILMDADGQHDPRELPKFINLLSKYQVVFGARYIGKGMPFWRLLGNRFLNYSVTFLFNLKLHDVWCGFRAFDASLYPLILWNSTDYSSDVEMAVNVGKHNLSHTELFVGTIYHDKGSVTGTTLHDGLKLLLELFLWKFNFS
jgi:glycosyltransferase involved in cell wall biosynthesis